MIGKCIVLLQNCTDLPEAVPGSCSDACLTLTDDKAIDVKVEVSDIKEEEDEDDDPLLIVPTVKADDEVSYVSFHLSSYLSMYLPTYLPSCLSVYFQSIHPSICSSNLI
jgi:hypothetical protein